MNCENCLHYEVCAHRRELCNSHVNHKCKCPDFKGVEKFIRLPCKVKEKVKKIKNRNDMKIGNIVLKKDTKLYKCPRCDSYIRPNQNYCSECGQALDWSTGND